MANIATEPGTRRNPFSRPWISAAVSLLVGVAAYLPQSRYDFVYDDRYLIEKNPVVRQGPWHQAFTKPYWPADLSTDPLYRPISTLSLRACYSVFGDHPAGYRIVNAVLHGLCASLTALLGLTVWRRSSAGWLAGLLFAVHPVHTEAVAMVVGRAELLAGLFGLGLLVQHSRSKRKVESRKSKIETTIRHHLSLALLFGLALGSKEHAALLLPAIVLLDWSYRRANASGEPVRARLRALAGSHYLGMILVLTVYLLMRWWMFGGRTTLPADHVNRWANPLVGAGWITKVALPPALLWLSAKLILLPIGLCPIWSVGGFAVPVTLWRMDVLGGVGVALCLAAAVVWGMKRRHPIGLALAWLGLFVVLPCHFIPAANWLFAERWLYLASAFAVLALAGLGRFRVVWLGVIPIIGVLLATTWQYQQCWRNTDVLMQSVVNRQPESYHGLIGLAFGLQRRGAILQGRAEIERLVRRFPDSPRSWYYQALLMEAMDRPEAVLEAVDRFVHTGDPQPLPLELSRAKRWALQRLQNPALGKLKN